MAYLRRERDLSIAGMYIQREVYQAPACIYKAGSICTHMPVSPPARDPGPKFHVPWLNTSMYLPGGDLNVTK